MSAGNKRSKLAAVGELVGEPGIELEHEQGVPPLAAAQGEGFGIGAWSDDLEVRRSRPYPNEARRIGAGGVLLRADQSVRDVDDGRNGDLAARRRTGTETPASLPHRTRCGRTDRAKTAVTCPNQDAQPAIGPTLPAPDLASGRSGPHDRFCSPGASNRAIGLATFGSRRLPASDERFAT